MNFTVGVSLVATLTAERIAVPLHPGSFARARLTPRRCARSRAYFDDDAVLGGPGRAVHEPPECPELVGRLVHHALQCSERTPIIGHVHRSNAFVVRSFYQGPNEGGLDAVAPSRPFPVQPPCPPTALPALAEF